MKTQPSRAADLFFSLRPLHWLKNTLVFAPVFFSGRFTALEDLARSACVFAVFCAAASAMYLLNDLADRRLDSTHPVKKKRPLASGRLKAGHHLFAAAVLGAAAVAASVAAGPGVPHSVIAYLCVGAAYSFFLKRVAGAGFIAIGAGLVLRVTAGAAAVGVEVSPWVYPCVLMLAVYVAIGKRVFDATASGAAAPGPDSALTLAGVATFAAYLAYSVSLENIHKYESRLLALTALPVLAGLVRYRFLVKRPPAGREHLAAAAADPATIASLLSWLAIFAWMIYTASPL